MKNVVEVKNLSKKFRVEKRSSNKLFSNIFKKKYEEVTAVNSVSFRIKRGEFVGFIGSNGAGKTTTLKCLCGLLNQDSGVVNVLGYEPIKRNHEFLKRISLVMGNKSQLWWDLPSIDTFLLNKEIYQIDDNEFDKSLNRMIEVLNIKDIVNIPVRKLSLGERMKCELVASLLHTPDLVFLDEPTLGLDILAQQALREFLKEYRREHNATIVLTSHNMEDVTDLCERIIIIDKGKIIYDDKLDLLTKSFVKKKYIKFVLGKSEKEEALSKVGEVISFDGKSGVISIGRKDTATTVAKFLKNFDVVDIDVEEPSLEDIAKKIFAGK